MEPVALITILVLIQYLSFGWQVGQARQRFGIQAPAMTGDPIFERYVRVHMNTLEQLVVFLPALWLFGFYIGPRLAALIGLAFLVGRQLYATAYVTDPGQRSFGFTIGFVAIALLVLGSGLGALASWF